MSSVGAAAVERRAVKFVPYQSALDAGFWSALSKLKLDQYGLDDQPRPISGFYTNSNAENIPALMNFDYTAFDSNAKVQPGYYKSTGVIKNFNTIDDFRTSDKQAFINDIGNQLWQDVVSGRAVQDPSLLSRFLLLTFADLKKYNYYYWFAFPAFKVETGFEPQLLCQTPLHKAFTQAQTARLLACYDTWRQTCADAYFLLLVARDDVTADDVSVHRLSEFPALDRRNKQVYSCVCDASTRASAPGWAARNLLTLVAYHWSRDLDEEVHVLSWRDRFSQGERRVTHSTVYRLRLPSLTQQQGCPKCVGWEKNVKGEMGPRSVNLSASMDPNKLAESAVDLNLKLMKWRLVPDLDLNAVSGTRCLLLGAGTLGCNVARCLLGWGVRNLTLVDNGRVSYSNPVRQSLFTFADSLNGGKPKAEAAAAALKQIFPGVNAVGESLSIPMPGHSVSPGVLEETRRAVTRLEALVDAHDVIFLLMDTRESRWLPTLLGAERGKIVINSALGFDTFLVLRHGVRHYDVSEEVVTSQGAASLRATLTGDRLGCYFCNDVVAPGDSTKDRTLDQQCTVSRPGMSLLASALAVELLVSVLLHPLRGGAPADTSASDSHVTADLVSPLGIVPHQIRGFLSRLHHLMPASAAFDKCTACSHTVVSGYRQRGFDFLLDAFNSPTFLEDVTGLTQMHADTCLSEVWEMDDDEDSEAASM